MRQERTMRAPKDMHHTFSNECDEDFLLLSDNKLQQKKSFERDMGRFKAKISPALSEGSPSLGTIAGSESTVSLRTI